MQPTLSFVFNRYFLHRCDSVSANKMATTVHKLSKSLSRNLLHQRRCDRVWSLGYPTGRPQHMMLSGAASSSSDGKPSAPAVASPASLGNEWRKQQLEIIENKFKGKQLEAMSIESEEELQPMWKEMEGRVTRRKLRTLADTGGKSGRMNIKKTDEDVWLQEGLYSTKDEDETKKE
mmetsp:Transcript_22987/g.48939  ORF Transcript_22987/g.48939 Transcript_22987/m.48939 type:complete len:176 (-) Transcript_22987:259-786(-)